jgi:hypothetical protein
MSAPTVGPQGLYVGIAENWDRKDQFRVVVSKGFGGEVLLDIDGTKAEMKELFSQVVNSFSSDCNCCDDCEMI